MTRITDNFCGYLNVGDDTFAYNVSNNIVTLLSAQSDHAERNKAVERIYYSNIASSEYLFGDDNNSQIAMLRNRKFNINHLGVNPSVEFWTPVIIKACGNLNDFYNKLTEDWGKFHAITFSGSNINAVCNPKMAVENPSSDEYPKTKKNGALGIKIRSEKEYTRSADFILDDEKVNVTFSISQTGAKANLKNSESYSLGELNSFIRFTFENPKDFDNIIKYYEIMRSLVAILSMRNNISFEVSLSQRISNNEYIKTGVCKISDHYQNYSTRKWHEVISIYDIFDYIPNLLEMIAKNEAESLLALLPDNNKNANQISITNVQDLCTALEVSHDCSKRRREKDDLINLLKKDIKTTISNFIKKHEEIDVYKETTISSAFQYLDFTLKQKILTLYFENRDVVDAIISTYSLPQLDEASIGSFVKLRNSKTHSGMIEWGDSANIYLALFGLKYACLFKHIGLSNEIIKSTLLYRF